MKSICTNEYSRKISKVKHQCPSNSVMDIVDFSAPPFLEVVRLRECRFLSSVYRRVGLKGEWRPREGRRGGDECNLQLSGDRQWNCRRKRERDRAAHFVSLTRSYLALRCVPGKVMMARSWMLATSPYMQRELSFVRKTKYPNALAKNIERSNLNRWFWSYEIWNRNKLLTLVLDHIWCYHNRICTYLSLMWS